MNRFNRPQNTECGCNHMNARNRINPASEHRCKSPAVQNGMNGCDNMVLAMAYVKPQTFTELYPQAEALCRGTLFRELDLPFVQGERRT